MLLNGKNNSSSLQIYEFYNYLLFGKKTLFNLKKFQNII